MVASAMEAEKNYSNIIVCFLGQNANEAKPSVLVHTWLVWIWSKRLPGCQVDGPSQTKLHQDIGDIFLKSA